MCYAAPSAPLARLEPHWCTDVISTRPAWSLLSADRPARAVSPDYMRARRAITARQPRWPAFSQLIVAATPERLAPLVASAAHAFDADTHALRFATCGPLTLLAEPGLDMGLRCVHEALADHVVTALGADGALVTRDAEGTLTLTIWRAGCLTLSWIDPLIDGAGMACTYLDDGRCTEEDARHFALRALGLDEDTAELDRHAFIELMLKQLGLPALSPDLAELPCAPLI